MELSRTGCACRRARENTPEQINYTEEEVNTDERPAGGK